MGYSISGTGKRLLDVEEAIYVATGEYAPLITTGIFSLNCKSDAEFMLLQKWRPCLVHNAPN